MEPESILNELGLKKNKATVYLAALGMGSGSAVEIASQARLPRTTTHEILGQLAEMGLVGFITKGRTRIYTAEPPEKLKMLLKEKERQLQSVLPDIRSMMKTKGIRPRIRVYNGIEGVKTVFEDTLTVSDKLLRGILSMADLYKIPGKNYMDGYVKRRVGAGIRLQVIRSESKEVEETWPSSVAESRELRYARGLEFPMTIYLYDNKVGIIGTEKENFGMIIESADFFQTQMNLFDTLWDISRIAKQQGAESNIG